MSYLDEKPTQANKQGGRYPTAKTYDQIRAEREQMRHLRESRRSRFPIVVILFIFAFLGGFAWLIYKSIPYLMNYTLMAAVLGVFIASLLWLLCFVLGMRKIRSLFS